MKKTEKNKFNYIIYADASGDDGLVNPSIKTPGCSSLTQVVAYFTTKVLDDDYNMQVLNKLKTSLGISTDKEIKHRHILKAHDKNKAFSIIQELKGTLYAVVCFKKDYLKKDNKEYAKDTLSALLHLAPSISAKEEGQKLLVFDHMKAKDETIIPNVKLEGIDEIIFKDSKDPKFALIQIADIFSGIIRDFVENFEDKDVNRPLCYKTKKYCNPKLKDLCKFKNKKATIPFATNLCKILPFLYHDLKHEDHCAVIPIRLTSIPLSSYKRYIFINCIFINKYV